MLDEFLNDTQGCGNDLVDDKVYIYIYVVR